MLFSLISIVTGGILSLTSGMIKKQKEKKQVKVFIRMDDAQIDVECLVDSGNLVRDPIDGKPVIFIPHHKAVSLWGGRLADILQKGNFLALSSEEFQIYQPKIRLVPCKTIHQGGLLMCIRADYIRIEDVGKEALIAICGDDKMSGCGICPASLL